MDTSYWGPSAWKLLHTLVNMYQTRDSSSYYLFFKTIPDILPCPLCQKSLKQEYKINPIPKCKSKKQLQKWLYSIHNQVNNRLRKEGYYKSKNPSFKIITQKYINYSHLFPDSLPFLYTISFNCQDKSLTSKQKKNFVFFFKFLFSKCFLNHKITKAQKCFKHPMDSYLTKTKLTRLIYQLEKIFDKKCQTYYSLKSGNKVCLR